MTMTVNLGALEGVVERLVAEGRFGSKSEVLRHGVRLVEEREAALAALHAELEAAIRQADAGDLIDLDEAEAMLDAEFSEAVADAAA